jgi:ABC-type multidrug transport system ATPase subunit
VPENPLIEVVRLRIDVGGRPAIDGLSLKTTGDRVLVLGAARALFEAASGARRSSHGELKVDGASPSEGAGSGRLAGAALDPPLAPRWTARSYAFWSARLAGHSQARARELAERALDRIQASRAADVPLGKAERALRRAAVVAAAIATDAPVLLLEDPTAGLPDDQARALGKAIVGATAERRTAIFAGLLPLASPLATDADEAVVIAGSEVVAQGAPAELAARERVVTLRVHGDTEDFAKLVRSRGAEVRGEGAILEVDLGADLRVKDLLQAASETASVIIEVRPVARAFA